MSEYAGRIAIGAILAVALVVGIAFELNYLVPNNVSTITSSGTAASTTSSASLITASSSNTRGWFGDEATPSGCGNMTWTARSTRDGYIMDMYISSPVSPGQDYLLGSNLCFYTYLQNLDNRSSSSPSNENLTVMWVNDTEAAAMSHTVSMVTYFESSCPVPAYSGSFGANSTGWNCEVIWNTSQPYNGTLPIATDLQNGYSYTASATVTMSNSTSTIRTGEAFGLTTTIPTYATTSGTSTITPALSCGGQIFKLLTPLQSGPISLKVTTDQGTIVNNNGTVFVTHVGANGTSNYCLRLEANSTGYLQIAANDGFSPTGTYNMTIFAGFGQGPGYEGSLPPVTVMTGTSVEMTLSVPSGELSIVTSTQGSSQVSTTTTTVTNIESKG
jgi:hypothetical protein